MGLDPWCPLDEVSTSVRAFGNRSDLIGAFADVICLSVDSPPGRCRPRSRASSCLSSHAAFCPSAAGFRGKRRFVVWRRLSLSAPSVWADLAVRIWVWLLQDDDEDAANRR